MLTRADRTKIVLTVVLVTVAGAASVFIIYGFAASASLNSACDQVPLDFDRIVHWVDGVGADVRTGAPVHARAGRKGRALNGSGEVVLRRLATLQTADTANCIPDDELSAIGHFTAAIMSKVRAATRQPHLTSLAGRANQQQSAVVLARSPGLDV